MKHTYIITDKNTGQAVYEFFDCKLIDRVNLQKYKVQTALEHLYQLNYRLKQCKN